MSGSCQCERSMREFGKKCVPCIDAETKPDAINPQHYKQGGIECIEVIEALGIAEQFCRGTAIKYLYRIGGKDDELQEAKKALWYVDRLVKNIEKRKECSQ